jgi:hypothetical protein
MTQESGKVSFLIILFKIMHDVRKETSNFHHITWIQEGIRKEFNQKRRRMKVGSY